jgi:hypothetical protein
VLDKGWVAAATGLESEVGGLGSWLGHAVTCAGIVRKVISCDWLMAEVIGVRAMSVVDNLLYVYPRLIKIGEGTRPLTGKSLEEGAVIVAHCRDKIWLWEGREEDGEVDRVVRS